MRCVWAFRRWRGPRLWYVGGVVGLTPVSDQWDVTNPSRDQWGHSVGFQGGHRSPSPGQICPVCGRVGSAGISDIKKNALLYAYIYRFVLSRKLKGCLFHRIVESDRNSVSSEKDAIGMVKQTTWKTAAKTYKRARRASGKSTKLIWSGGES